ncbi:MAG: SDR family NAD(P)-dependent oxidoreductase [Spirochaetota bacterium]
MSKRILVTGGAGFIGSHLVDELLARGNSVIALDNLANGSLDNLAAARKSTRFTFLKGDVLNPHHCKKAVQGIDAIFHLACLGVRHSLHSPFENHRVNAEGTLRVLEAARQYAVEKFFYISTSEIYGGVQSFPITEHALPQPFTVYGASKLAGEHYANAFRVCFGLETTVLRIFNNFGPRAHYEGDAGEIIPRSIIAALAGKQPVIFGDGKITRDFFYVKDTARALASLLDIDGISGVTMNIGTGVEITMKTLIETMLSLMGRTAIGIRHEDDRPADVPRLWVDAGKFKALTQFKSQFSFEDGLRETIAYYEALTNRKELYSSIPLKNWERE